MSACVVHRLSPPACFLHLLGHKKNGLPLSSDGPFFEFGSPHPRGGEETTAGGIRPDGGWVLMAWSSLGSSQAPGSLLRREVGTMGPTRLWARIPQVLVQSFVLSRLDVVVGCNGAGDSLGIPVPLTN